MNIIFAGGGTAGHVNPAIAAAQYICGQEESRIYLSGGKGNIEERLAQKAGFDIFTFPLSGLSRGKTLKSMAGNARALARTAAAIRKSKAILRKIRPDVVVGTGGYASFPMVRAAMDLGLPTALMEVNAAPGMVTRRLAHRADVILLAYAETAPMLPAARRTVHTGTPVRAEIAAARDKVFTPLFDNNLPTVTCFWGSVGAQYMNEKIAALLPRIAAERPFNLLYAAGEKHMAELGDLSALEGADNIDIRPYIDEMDRALACSDLVLCRAGGTLMELCAVGRAGLIVPSPWVAENHQEKNARTLESAGAARVLTEREATPDTLYAAILELLSDHAALERMGRAALDRAQPQALHTIYRTLKELIASS